MTVTDFVVLYLLSTVPSSEVSWTFCTYWVMLRALKITAITPIQAMSGILSLAVISNSVVCFLHSSSSQWRSLVNGLLIETETSGASRDESCCMVTVATDEREGLGRKRPCASCG